MSDFFKPVVSVCVITYNQELFIRQTIEGILMQQCHFPFELVIGEDFSSDSTRKICEEYARLYPHIIRLLFSEKNIGGMANFIRTLQACTGKYIAVCEGDDYWDDPYKLKKQVDFLEENVNCSACFTNAKIINEIENTKRVYLNGLKEGYVPADWLIMKGGASYPTASIVFRPSSFLFEHFNEINELNGDSLLIMILSMQGDVYFLDQITCTYRIWKGGIYSSVMNDKKKTIERKRRIIVGLKKLKVRSKKPFRKYIKNKISAESLFILRNEGLLRNIHYLSNLNTKDAIRLLIL